MTDREIERMVSMEQKIDNIEKNIGEIKQGIKNFSIVEYQVKELRSDCDSNTKEIQTLKKARGSRFEKIFDTLIATASGACLIQILHWLSGGKL
ncbi:MAG TPA: hypothetical protein DCO75_02135 [Fibrobacteres bacterium]|jgi:hypothetical protein|nr:hypothetical protein [Fibrobacterota bacterium]